MEKPTFGQIEAALKFVDNLTPACSVSDCEHHREHREAVATLNYLLRESLEPATVFLGEPLQAPVSWHVNVNIKSSTEIGDVMDALGKALRLSRDYRGVRPSGDL